MSFQINTVVDRDFTAPLDLSKNQATYVFIEAIQKSKNYAKQIYGEDFDDVTFEGLGEGSSQVRINPTESQMIILHFKNETSREIGTVLVEAKSAEEIFQEIKEFIDKDKAGIEFLTCAKRTHHIPSPCEITVPLEVAFSSSYRVTHLASNGSDIYHYMGHFIPWEIIGRYFRKGFVGEIHIPYLAHGPIAVSLSKKKLEEFMGAHYSNRGYSYRVREFALPED